MDGLSVWRCIIIIIVICVRTLSHGQLFLKPAVGRRPPAFNIVHFIHTFWLVVVQTTQQTFHFCCYSAQTWVKSFGRKLFYGGGGGGWPWPLVAQCRTKLFLWRWIISDDAQQSHTTTIYYIIFVTVCAVCSGDRYNFPYANTLHVIVGHREKSRIWKKK